MGSGLARRAARAQSDLSVDAERPVRQAGLLAILALDGVLSAILGAFFLPLYLGAMPFPISALISGLLNAALVWAGLQVTQSPRRPEGTRSQRRRPRPPRAAGRSWPP